VVHHHGVTLVGISNLAALMASDASQLYARNVSNIVHLLWNTQQQTLNIDMNDEIIAGSLLCQRGEFLKPKLLEKRP
jgi:NAD(P) transhydrogenase subunit alpha